MSYAEPNRNLDIVNFNAVAVPFYLESGIVVRMGQCNSLPRLVVPPIDQACKGVSFLHNPGVSDSDNDSVSYELFVPMSNTIQRFQTTLTPIT